MPRWYPLCNGADIPACQGCRRFAPNNGSAMHEPQQAWIKPELIGIHCNNFIERPAHSPSDRLTVDSR